MISPSSKFYLSQYLGLTHLIHPPPADNRHHLFWLKAISTTLSKSLDNLTKKQVLNNLLFTSMAISHLGDQALGGLGRPAWPLTAGPWLRAGCLLSCTPCHRRTPRRATFSWTLSASPPCLHTSSSVNLSRKMWHSLVSVFHCQRLPRVDDTCLFTFPSHRRSTITGLSVTGGTGSPDVY